MRRLSVVLGLTAALLLAAGGPALADAPFGVSGQVTDQAGVLSSARQGPTSSRPSTSCRRTRASASTSSSSTRFDGLNGKQWVAADRGAVRARRQRRHARRRGRGAALRRPPRQRDRRRQAEHRRHRRRRAEARGRRLGRCRGRARRGHRRRLRVGRLAPAPRTLAVVVGADPGRRRRLPVLPVAGPPPPGPRGHRRDRAPAAGGPLRGDADRAAATTGPAPPCSTSTSGPAQRARTSTSPARYYGEEAVPGFDRDLATSRDELARAFTIRQELDDEIPEDEPTQRRMLAELLQLTGAAGERLKAQAAALDELRERERTAPQVHRGPAARGSASCSSGCPPGGEARRRCSGGTPSAAVTSVAENVARGRRPPGRRASRRWTWRRQDQAVRPGRPRRWAGCAAPRTPSGRARRCSTRSTGWPPTSTAAEQRLPAVRAETEKDLAEARSLIRGGRPQRPAAADRPGRGGAHRGRRRAAAGRRLARDPLTALRQLEEGDLALEQALSVARDAQTQARRAGRAARPGAAHRPVHHRGGRGLHQHAPRRGRPGGPHPARRGAAAPRRRGGHGAGSDPAAALREARDADRLAPVRARGRAARRRPVVAADRLRRLRRRLRRRAGAVAGAAATAAATAAAG